MGIDPMTTSTTPCIYFEDVAEEHIHVNTRATFSS